MADTGLLIEVADNGQQAVELFQSRLASQLGAQSGGQPGMASQVATQPGVQPGRASQLSPPSGIQPLEPIIPEPMSPEPISPG